MHVVKRCGFLLLTTMLVLPIAHAQDKTNWIGGWATAMIDASTDRPEKVPVLADVTLRQMLRIGVDGHSVRIRLSNTFGTQPVTLDAVSIGRRTADSGSALEKTSLHAVTFHGRTEALIAPGATLDSDAVSLDVHANDTLGISIHVARTTTPSTWHSNPLQDQYLSSRGNYTGAATMPVARTLDTIPWLSGVEVATATPTSVVVALGDSITNGFRSTVNANHRYPDVLADRLHDADRTGTCRHAVLNMGIDGNEVTSADGAIGPGENMVKRFDRDVLGQRGVRFVLLLGGINDIGEPTMVAKQHGNAIDGRALAAHIIDGLQAIVAKSHAAGLPVYGGTILPFAGTQGAYSAQGEIARGMVNAWILHRASYDGVVDFDRALRDPARPLQLRVDFDSGDHLHPNDSGYRAMAGAISLALFDCAASTTYSVSDATPP
ncbi:SGNH/GDSL hydrolase family protein [Rhodanobacter sp. L36]|uniref:SGNH/GDSL hydrolase family protein n=1 Tax=Rhodanobacter sp. L36 TaxID=1747221 RepID=UPI00131D530C|nr:SGNH/GDSL hydrolase family protein [Rhodanobacter sp. L36]